LTDVPHRNSASRLLGGRYRLLEQLGAGANAAVHRASDEFLGREVAVKVIPWRPADEDGLRRRDAEVEVLARLNHTSLVTLLDAGADRSDAGQPLIYLVMELAQGPDLRHRLAEGPLSARQVAQIGHDLAEGLDYIHHCGVVHRDVKPSNIMLFDYLNEASRMRAKLADFGIALRVDEQDPRGTGVLGTAGYLSPEQAKGETVGPPSDVYSLGLVLVECLTGEAAYPGPPLESAVARLLHDPQIPKNLDPQWRLLLKAMTAADPSARPSAGDVSLALDDIAASQRGRHKVDAGLLPADEAGRMEAVHRYDILDTPPDGAFDRITATAARLFSVPIAIVSVVDHDRIWFKSHFGTDVEQIGREPGLCASAILQDGPWIVNNAPVNPRTLANPLAAGEFGLQFYAGVPLRTRGGYNLGTLCILDHEPRPLSNEHIEALEDLAALVMEDLELRLASRRLPHAVPPAPAGPAELAS
jgi:eukaryotic-like serine/threonine-protein kinase